MIEVKKVRNRPLVVNAFRWDGEVFHTGPLKDIIFNVYEMPSVVPGGRFVGSIRTLEGVLDIESGVWIVGPGVRGEYWPVQDDVFRKSYEGAA